MSVLEQQLPHSIEAERALLGSILVDPEVVGDIFQLVPDSEHFYRKPHQVLYGVLLELIDDGGVIDLITVLSELEGRGLLEEVGGRTSVMDLMAVDHAGHAQHYAQIVRNKSMVRRMIRAGQEIIRQSIEESHDIERLIDNCESTMYEVTEEGTHSNVHAMDDLVRQAMDEIVELMESGGETRSGTPSGFIQFDNMTAGLHGGEMVIIAARPSMGKTSFAINVCLQVALAGTPVAIFSLEVGKDQLVRQMLCCRAEVNSHSLRTGDVGPADYDRLGRAATELEACQMFINDTPSLSVMACRTAARRMKKRHDIGMIMIDYLQLMEGSSNARREGRQQEVSEIARGLKALARELDIPVIALAQLNRKVDEREDHRPRLSDLRESGSIEQEADLICFLYRPEYYDRENPDVEGLAEVILAKQRHGPTGIVQMEFIKQYQRFRDLSEWSTAGP